MKYALIIAVLFLFGAGNLYAEDGEGVPAEDLSESPTGDEHAADGGPLSEEGDRVDESTLTFDDETEQAQAEEVDGLTSFGAGDFIRMVLVLGLVVLSIYVLFYFLKKAGGHGDRADKSLRLLGTTTLQGSRAVHLIEVGGRVFLVGSAEQSVNLISELQDQETIDQLLLEHGSSVAGSSPFGKRTFSDFVGDMFRGAIPAQGKPVHDQASGDAAAGSTVSESASRGASAGSGEGGSRRPTEAGSDSSDGSDYQRSGSDRQYSNERQESSRPETERFGSRGDDSFISRQRERLQHL